MFNMDDQALIRKWIDERKSGAYVSPLYVRNYNDRYSIMELKDITNFNPSGFRVGFGIHVSIMDRFSFPNSLMSNFECMTAFSHYNDDYNTNERYIVLEIGNEVDDVLNAGINTNIETMPYSEKAKDGLKEKLKPDAIHTLEQIQYYQNMLFDFLSKQQEAIRKKRIQEALSEYSS